MENISLTPQEHFQAGVSLELEFWNHDEEHTSDAMTISKGRIEKLRDALQDSDTATIGCISEQLQKAIDFVKPESFSELIWLVHTIGAHNGERRANQDDKLKRLLDELGDLEDLLGDE